MNRTIKNIILISGIIPATFLCYLAVIWFIPFITDFSEDWRVSFIIISFLFGILGYIGLWRNLLFNHSKKNLNSVLLLLGIIGGCLFTFLVTGGTRTINWITSFKEPLGIFIFLWPLIVAVFILVLNNKEWFKP